MQSPPPLLRIGTRGSALALVQAKLVRTALALQHGVSEDRIAIVTFVTSGDRLTDRPLLEAGGKGLFSREIESALLADEIDLGVHSCKDLAAVLPEGLTLAAFPEREDVRDAFVSHTAASLEVLPEGARLGSSSIRRSAQMLRLRPDLRIVPFRGNVDTRLRKLADGVADATLLAAAGLKRLGRLDAICAYLDPRDFPPAPAQGAIAIEIRSSDTRTAELVAPLNHPATACAIAAERALVAILDASCRTPMGVFTEPGGDTLTLTGQLLSPDGTECFTSVQSGPAGDPVALGTRLGRELLGYAGESFMQRLEPEPC